MLRSRNCGPFCRLRHSVSTFTAHFVPGDNICRGLRHVLLQTMIYVATVVCFCRGGERQRQTDRDRERQIERQTHRQTGQNFNNCIFDDRITFSSTLFRDRTKTSWNVCLLQPCCTMVQVIIWKRDWAEFLQDGLMLSLWCKKNTDAKLLRFTLY